MKVRRLNRVELLLTAESIDNAVSTFAALLNVDIEKPHLIAETQVLSTVCWEAGIEFIAPGGPDSVLHRLLKERGYQGAIGPIVWEVGNVDDIRAHMKKEGFEVQFEYISENGGRQITFDSAQFFGYSVTFIERPAGPPEPAAGSKAMFKRINRVELLLPEKDLQPAVDLFSRILDVKIPPLDYLPEHHTRTITCWDAGFEIFGPGDSQSVLHALLDQKGHRGAIGPIVWEVEDIDRIRDHALSLGHKLVYELAYEDRRQICFDASTLFGYIGTFTQPLR